MDNKKMFGDFVFKEINFFNGLGREERELKICVKTHEN